MGPGFIFVSPERINSRLMQLLWLKCEFLKFEELWQKFDCNFELYLLLFCQELTTVTHCCLVLLLM